MTKRDLPQNSCFKYSEVNVFVLIKKMKEKIHLRISTNAEKSCDKINIHS